MGYADHLKNVLKPLRLYVLDEGIGAAELESCGELLDGLYDYLLDCERNMLPMTADADGLEAFELLLPYIPETGSLEARRAAVRTLMMADFSVVTPEKLGRALSVMGASVSETDTPYTVTVSFDETPDEDDEELLKSTVLKIMPCHLDVEFDM